MKAAFMYSDLVEFLGIPQSEHDFVIEGFSPLVNTQPRTMTWTRTFDIDLSKIKASAVICPEGEHPNMPGVVFIPVANPGQTIAKVIYHFSPFEKKVGVEKTAAIGEGCSIGQDVYIGHYAVIGNNVTIGDGTSIDAHVTLYDGVAIGKNCTILAGCVIGAPGFGFERECEGYIRFPHICTVVIGDNVEIGCNTCINRGALTNTVIHDNVKIADLCSIAHGNYINEAALVTAGVIIAGSVRIGRNVWCGINSTIKEGLVVGDNAFIGMGADVIIDVKEDEVVAGIPAKPVPWKPPRL